MADAVDPRLVRSADELARYGDDAILLATHLATRLPEPEMQAYWREVTVLLGERARQQHEGRATRPSHLSS